MTANSSEKWTTAYRSALLIMLGIIGWFTRNAYLENKEWQSEMMDKFEAFVERVDTSDRAMADKIASQKTAIGLHELRITQIEEKEKEQRGRQRGNRQPEDI